MCLYHRIHNKFKCSMAQMFYQEFCNNHGFSYEVHNENRKSSMDGRLLENSRVD